jgi:DNA (cytosine-5)-methyltransferase 1
VRYGSLFSGYGGLDRAVEAVFGAKAAWHAEIEPAPCKVLEARWPGVPNLGDVSNVDWSTVERPEIMCGGFPCTDLSAAGRMAGLKPGTRSGLWSEFARGIKALRPELVVIENVRGLLSTVATHPAHQMGWCPGCLGDEPERVVLRALGAVLGDLADLGFDAEWIGLPASAVGAPHPRFRIFVLAWPTQDAWREPGQQRRPAASGQEEGRWTRANAGGRGGVPTAYAEGDGFAPQLAGGYEQEWARPEGNRPSVAHAAGNRRDQGWTEPAGIVGRPDAACGGGEPTADADGDQRRPQQVAEPWGGDSAVAGHAGEGVEWGVYGPAIARWESVIGRSAPAPTFLGKNGQPKLSPYFVEFLMGLPDGWVTDVSGITVNEWLKMLGNGVVPQQAEAGIRELLRRTEGER